MKNKRKDIMLIAGMLACIIILVWLTGCTNHTVKESLTVEIDKPNGTKIKVKYRPEMATWSLLSITGVKDTEHITSTASTIIGDIKTEPDPDSIDSAGGFFGEIMKEFLK